MVSDETGLPDLRAAPGKDATDLSAEGGVYVKWKARLGKNVWGNPTVAGGCVLVGTSGPKDAGGALMCFDAATGKLLWQLICPVRNFPTPERPAAYPQHSPWDYLVTTHAQTNGWGLCSSAAIEGDQVYTLTSRGEVVCLDIHGLADGNQGPFSDEAKYKAGEGHNQAALEAPDADILWVTDLWTTLATRPADTFSNAALIDGKLLYISTCNGIERWPYWHGKPASPPNPKAPNLIALDKRNGRIVAQDAEAIGPRLLHGQWSPPSLGMVNGKKLVFYGGGDGVCYAFEALPEVPEGQQPVTLRKVWSYDCNPAEYKGVGVENYSLGDKDLLQYLPQASRPAMSREIDKHRDPAGRILAMSEIIGSPVFHDNRVYVAIGRDPRHGLGRGALHCIDATGTGDISQSGRRWCFDQIDRTLGTPSVADGLVYLADLAGRLFCLEADTGAGAPPWWLTGRCISSRGSRSTCWQRAGKRRCWPRSAWGLSARPWPPAAWCTSSSAACFMPCITAPQSSPWNRPRRPHRSPPRRVRRQRLQTWRAGPVGEGRGATVSRPRCRSGCRRRNCFGANPWPATVTRRFRSAKAGWWWPITTVRGITGGVLTPRTASRYGSTTIPTPRRWTTAPGPGRPR
jgi:outer membrane protein assembly factor BamB